MRLLDKLYLNLYWCGNLGKGGGYIEHTFGFIFYLPVSGIFMWTFAQIESNSDTRLPASGLVVISLLLSYWLVERLINKYFTEEKRDEIIKKYKKPGPLRYLIFLTLLFGGIALGITCFKASADLLS